MNHIKLDYTTLMTYEVPNTQNFIIKSKEIYIYIYIYKIK